MTLILTRNNTSVTMSDVNMMNGHFAIHRQATGLFAYRGVAFGQHRRICDESTPLYFLERRCSGAFPFDFDAGIGRHSKIESAYEAWSHCGRWRW
jgi:hypothetical protein